MRWRVEKGDVLGWTMTINVWLWHGMWIISKYLTNILSRSQSLPHTYHRFYAGYSWQGAWIFGHRILLFWRWKGKNINDQLCAEDFGWFPWGDRKFCNIASWRPSLLDKRWRLSNREFSTWRTGLGLQSFNGTIIIYFLYRKKRYTDSHCISYHKIE